MAVAAHSIGSCDDEEMWTDDRALSEIWICIGHPGFSGDDKQRRHDLLSKRFGPDGWRWRFVVRGRLVGFDEAIAEYEQAYRVHLAEHPEVVTWLTSTAGNVYDHSVDNIWEDDYAQPGPAANHYQDISVRRVIAEMQGIKASDLTSSSKPSLVELTDLTTGEVHRVHRAPGFHGDYLVQLRDARSPGYPLNPALVPVHDPALITTRPNAIEWFHREGCGHLSVEAFWQTAKVIEVRYDRFLALGDMRDDPLRGV
jgi:hypothetical protein